MIGHLRGRVLAVSPDRLLLDVQGVGYDLQIPLSTFYELERAKAAPEVNLFVHTHLREDEISLFGFWTETEKRLFGRLIGVSGIGPRLARSILSGMASEDLASAIASGDLGRLSTVPGVGKKTAERLVLELRDKMRDFAASEKATGPTAAGEDVVSALVNLGYKAVNAERAVAEARRATPDAPFHDLLRAALKQLSRL